MPKVLQLEALNQMDGEQFVAVLGGVFEHSPWIAEQAEAGRPFASLKDLYIAMVSEVNAASIEQKLELLRAHPELAGKAARAGELTDCSTREQKGAGLTNLSPEQMQRISAMNKAYRERFGFPFIIAVKNHTRDGIFSEFERRLANDRDEEIRTALDQVGYIARFRLADLFAVEPRRFE